MAKARSIADQWLEEVQRKAGDHSPSGSRTERPLSPTGKPFDVLYSTEAQCKDGKIAEEYRCYGNGTSLTKIGLA